jgi:hypothetical protein
MPPPPILEIYVVWHPDDQAGAAIGDALITHFHGPAYAGLAGGAVEVYLRHAGWEGQDGPPRPLPFMKALPAALEPAQITAVVPVLGRNLARAVRNNRAWRQYVEAIFDADVSVTAKSKDRVVAVYPVRLPGADLAGTQLAEVSARPQALAQGIPGRRPWRATWHKLSPSESRESSPTKASKSELQSLSVTLRGVAVRATMSYA